MITLVSGDITDEDCDAIVNAAAPHLLGGGGVDGAIHRAAGPALLAHCRALPVVRDGMRCPPGHAVATPGFGLPVRHIIHTVGPVYRTDPDPPRTLARAYENSLKQAILVGARTVAFPAISTGVYGYPLDPAAQIAVGVLRAHAATGAFDALRCVLFSPAARAAWERALAR